MSTKCENDASTDQSITDSESNSDSSVCEVPDSQDAAREKANQDRGIPKLMKHTMFLNEEGRPMHFIILNRNSDERIRLHELLYDHMASYSESLEKMTPHTAVLVADDSRTWSYARDVFKISYIHESIKAGVILDISKFLKSKSLEFIKSFDFMKIVYSREYSWDDVPAEYKLQIENADTDFDSDDSNVTAEPERSSGCRPKKLKRTRCAYSIREKQAILRYIIANNRYKDVKGIKLWQDMEEADVCPIRTWQSMKEHFIKTIVKELSSYSLTSNQIKQIKQYTSKKNS